MPSPPDSPSTFPRLVGHAVERVEDAALLTGRGRFAHDVGERSGTAHAAVLRSPHAHAEIVSLDAAAALSMPEVVTVLTGAEVAAWSRAFIAGVKQPMRHYALAVDRVRYTGEPVAVVVARDRYGAEDALERIEVEYRELDPVVDAVAAAAPGAPLLHRDVGSNVVSDRRLRYGDPDAAVAGAAHLAAMKLRERLARIASTGLNATPEALVFAGGRIFAADNPENAIPLRRAAGIAHWSPDSLPEHAEPGLRETIFWSMPGLDPPDEDDRVNSSGAYGFIFDLCAVEVDDTGRVRIDEYVTMHDAGTRLNPALVDGQIRGGFAHGVGAALYEELAYAGDGSFLSGTFADYLVPTACEVPAPTILHMESPSPFTPLGAKGVGEGNTMSTPVCLANAVADALGIDDVELPMTPSKVASWLAGEEPLPPSTACGPGAITEVGVAQVEAGSTTPATPEVEDERSSKAPARVTVPPEPAAPGSTVLDLEKLSAAGPDAITGAGEVRIGVAPAAVWPILLDAERLACVIARVIAHVIMGLVPPTAGRAVVGGVDYREASRGDIRRLRRDIQMVFQDPVDSLNPRMTVEQNVRDPLRNAREPLSDVDGRIDRVLRQVGLGSEFRRLRPRRLSGGQAQRVALARALVVEPRVIVFDEPTSALDVTVQAQILDLLRVLMADGTRSYVFVSHDLATVQGLCDRVAVLYLGRIVEQGPADEVLERPCHLYTRALVDAVSTLSSRRTVVGTRLKRDLDEAWEAERCSLEPRCPHGEAACREPQTLRDLTRGHQAACWKA